MEVYLDSEPDHVPNSEQFGSSKIDLDNITEIDRDLEQNMDVQITSCEANVMSGHTIDKNVNGLENRMYNISDSNDSKSSLNSDIVQENDKSCQNNESIVNKIIELFEQEDDSTEIFENIDVQDNSTGIFDVQDNTERFDVQDNNTERFDVQDTNTERFDVQDNNTEIFNVQDNTEIFEDIDVQFNNTEIFENIDVQDASLSARSEDAFKEDFWGISNKRVKQDSPICAKKCQKSASTAIDDVQGPSDDSMPQAHESPACERLETSSGKEFICCGDENTLGRNSNPQENYTLDKLHPQSSSLDPMEEDKKLTILPKEVNAIGDQESCEVSYSSHLELSCPMVPEACLGDVGKEAAVQDADQNMCHTAPEKCSFQQMKKTPEHMKICNSECTDINGPITSSVVQYSDKMKTQTDGIEVQSSSKDNVTEIVLCKETEISSTVEYMNSTSRYPDSVERKTVSSLDKVHSTEENEQSGNVEIVACSVMLDKIDLQQQNSEVSLTHHAIEKHTTNNAPVQIQFQLGSTITSKSNSQNEGTTDSVESKEDLFKCALCSKSYSHKRSLDKHKRNIHPDHWRKENDLNITSRRKIFMCKYKCDKCSFRFFSIAGLIRHQNKSCSTQLADSPEDKSTSNSKQDIKGKEMQVLDCELRELKPLEQNVFSVAKEKSDSGNENTYICRFCGRQFSRRINLCQHEQMHVRKKLIAVKSENEQESIMSASQTDHSPVKSDASKQNQCKFCGRMISGRFNLFQHEQMHVRKKLNVAKSGKEQESLVSVSQNDNSPVNSDASKQHRCKSCGRNFSRRLNLIQHEQVHVREKLNVVKSEKEEYFISISQNGHSTPSQNVKSLVNSDVSKQHRCKSCGRMFSRKLNLIQHEQVHKKSNQAEMILDTKKSFGKKKSGVSGIGNHKCRFCARKFFRRCNLCQHERVCYRRQNAQRQKLENSSGTKILKSNSKKMPVSCVENPERIIYSNKSNSCQYCRKIFTTKYNLKRHEKLHEQKNKFLKQFTRNMDFSHLESHSQKRQQLEEGDIKNSSSSVKYSVPMDSSESMQNIKNDTKNAENHICKSCGRFFARRSNLCQHERVCQKRQIIQKQKYENSSRVSFHNSSLKNLSVNYVGNPLGHISSNKLNRCQYCKKFYSSNSNLRRHEKLHKQKKKFLKQENDSKRSEDSLFTKRKSVVSSDNWYTCQDCGKCFSRKLDLSKHYKFHNQKSTHLEHRDNISSFSSATDIKKVNSNKTEHVCRCCGRLFGRRSNLCQHERVCQRKHNMQPTSKNSSRTMTQNSSLKKVSVISCGNPLELSSNHKFNRCQYCKKFYSSKSNLKRHEKLHQQKKKFLKQINDGKRSDESHSSKAKSLLSNDLHMDCSESGHNIKNESNNNSDHICKFCGRLFARRSNLCQHERVCQRGQIIQKRKSMNNSRTKTPNSGVKNLSLNYVGNPLGIMSNDKFNHCHYCKKYFSSKSNLKRHEKLHMRTLIFLKEKNDRNRSDDMLDSIRNQVKIKSTDKRHPCQHCGKCFVDLSQHLKFCSRKNLKLEHNHTSKSDHDIKTENAPKTCHICRYCGRQFGRRSNLCQHENWHKQKNLNISKGDKNSSHICRFCGRYFERRVNLCQHERCHTKSSHRKKEKHTNSSHFFKKTKVGQRSQVTGKFFNNTESKKYKCKVCGMTVKSHSLLLLHKKKHMISSHTCLVCGKTFIRKFDLARHLRIHTGDQPHECDICLKGFRCRFNLVDHMGTHVLKEGDEFQCAACKVLFFDQQSIQKHLESYHTSQHNVSNLEPQIILNDNELEGNGYASGREGIERDSVINDVQSKMPIFSCGICGEIFREASCLFLHMGEHMKESFENENRTVTVKTEPCSPNMEMDSYQQLCRLQNNLSQNDIQNMNGYVSLSDFVNTIQNETVKKEISSLDGEDYATESLSNGTIDPSESASEFVNVKHISDMGVNVETYVANNEDKNKIMDFTETNKTFQCGLCMHTFSSKQGLSQHTRWHANTDVDFTQTKKEYCTICKIHFASKSSFKMHLNWHNNEQFNKVVASDKLSIPLRPYTCEKCGNSFTRKDSLAKHKRMMHYSQDNESGRKVGMSKEAVKSVVPNGFKCQVCGCSYAQRACLVQHLLHKHNLTEKNFEAVHEENEKPLRCQLFQNNTMLACNSPENQEGTQKAYNCIFCKKQYIKKHAYLLHTSNVHPSYYQQVLGKVAEESVNIKQCKYCKTCYNPNDNAGHNEGFNCKSCEKVFPCKSCFIQHLDLPEFSKLEGSFLCCVCHLNFLSRKELEDHVSLHASDIGKYSCRLCRQIFKYKQHLTRHKRVHGIRLKKSYPCKWCKKVFPYEDMMLLHEKRMHCTDHMTSKLSKEQQVLLKADLYNCANTGELNVRSPPCVGSDISSPLPRKYEFKARDQAYHKDIATNLVSEFPLSIKQEPVDSCDYSVHESTCTNPVMEVDNHDTDSNRVGSDTAEFSSSHSVKLNENAEQDDIQKSLDDSDLEEVDDIHYRNISPVDRSDVLRFMRSAKEAGQIDSLALLKEVLEDLSEIQLNDKSPLSLAYLNNMDDFYEQQKGTELSITRMKSSDKNYSLHCCCRLTKNSEKGKDAACHSHHQDHQLCEDDETARKQESNEQIQCNICSKIVYSKELVSHLQNQTEMKLYECKHCNECFLSALSYSEHMENNYGEIVCSACGKTFSERKDLTLHIRKLNCSMCEAVFMCHETFSKHLECHLISDAEKQNDGSDHNQCRDRETISEKQNDGSDDSRCRGIKMISEKQIDGSDDTRSREVEIYEKQIDGSDDSRCRDIQTISEKQNDGSDDIRSREVEISEEQIDGSDNCRCRDIETISEKQNDGSDNSRCRDIETISEKQIDGSDDTRSREVEISEKKNDSRCRDIELISEKQNDGSDDIRSREVEISEKQIDGSDDIRSREVEISEKQNDGSDDSRCRDIETISEKQNIIDDTRSREVEIITAQDKAEENLKTLLADQRDAGVMVNSVITSSLAAWKQMPAALLLESSIKADRNNDTLTEIIENPGNLLSTCRDDASHKDSEVLDIKPDIDKLNILMQNTDSDMETIARHKQAILDRTTQNSPFQVRAETIHTDGRTLLHVNSTSRSQNEQFQATPSTSSNWFPVRTEQREPGKVPTIRKEFFNEDNPVLTEESGGAGRTEPQNAGLKPCYVQLKKVDYKILTCLFCFRILVTRHALKRHYLFHLVPGHKFSY